MKRRVLRTVLACCSSTPSQDGTLVTCVWESGSVEDVQAYVDEIMGDLEQQPVRRGVAGRLRRGAAGDSRATRGCCVGAPGRGASPGPLIARSRRRDPTRGGTPPHATGATIGRWSARYDRGGRQTDAPIDRREHELADWELTDARARRSARRRRGDERRRAQAWHRACRRRSTSARRTTSAGCSRRRRFLVEKASSPGPARPEARVTFAPGQTVRRGADARGHHRTPGYLKGAPGRSSAHGPFANPETRARRRRPPAQRLYLVGSRSATSGLGTRVPPRPALRRRVRALARGDRMSDHDHDHDRARSLTARACAAGRARALVELLVEKGVIEREDVRRRIDWLVSAFAGGRRPPRRTGPGSTWSSRVGCSRMRAPQRSSSASIPPVAGRRRAREHRGRAPRGRVHALLLLPESARPASGLVQRACPTARERCLIRAYAPGVRPSAPEATSRCESSTRLQTSATSSSHAAPRAPRA